MLVLLAVFSRYMPTVSQAEDVSYSAFLKDVKAGRVDSVVIQGEIIAGTRKDSTKFQTFNPETDYSALIGTLDKADVNIVGKPPKPPNFVAQLFLQLAPALLRPGRFDRQVVVPLPDVRGREQILRVHMRRVPLAEDVKPALIARGTPGFSGADLANLVNEAALFAARANKRIVGMDEFERAKDKIMMGAERRSMVMTEPEKRMTAYHEAGHAIVGMTVPEHDPVYKVTIIPRGRALGVTQFLPEQDRYSLSKRRIESSIATLFGGRVAEELIFGPESVTTGASNDIERATDLARNMVTKWGLSDKLGPLTYTEESGEVFLGRSVTQHKQVSDGTAQAIDEEVRRVVESNYKRSKEILTSTLDKLHVMAEALIKYETIDEQQLKDIMEGRTPRPPSDWDDTLTNKPPKSPSEGPSGPIGSPAGQH